MPNFRIYALFYKKTKKQQKLDYDKHFAKKKTLHVILDEKLEAQVSVYRSPDINKSS
jgi:hypothetical protein